MMNAIVFPIAAFVLALLVIVALVRIFAGAILPLIRNQRLARRGLNYEPAYQRQRGSLLTWTFRLLPVIVVIAVVAAIAIPAFQNNYNRAQAAARDEQRMTDLRLMQNALDAYYLDQGAYPVSDSETYDASGFAAALSGLVTGGYLPALPNDPGGDIFVYQSTPDGSYYCLGADMEGTPPRSTCNTDKLGAALDTNYMVGP